MTQDKFYEAQQLLNQINECESVIGFLEARKTMPTFVNSCGSVDKSAIPANLTYYSGERIKQINSHFENAILSLLKKIKSEKADIEKKFTKL